MTKLHDATPAPALSEKRAKQLRRKLFTAAEIPLKAVPSDPTLPGFQRDSGSARTFSKIDLTLSAEEMADLSDAAYWAITQCHVQTMRVTLDYEGDVDDFLDAAKQKAKELLWKEAHIASKVIELDFAELLKATRELCSRINLIKVDQPKPETVAELEAAYPESLRLSAAETLISAAQEMGGSENFFERHHFWTLAARGFFSPVFKSLELAPLWEFFFTGIDPAQAMKGFYKYDDEQVAGAFGNRLVHKGARGVLALELTVIRGLRRMWRGLSDLPCPNWNDKCDEVLSQLDNQLDWLDAFSNAMDELHAEEEEARTVKIIRDFAENTGNKHLQLSLRRGYSSEQTYVKLASKAIEERIRSEIFNPMVAEGLISEEAAATPIFFASVDYVEAREVYPLSSPSELALMIEVALADVLDNDQLREEWGFHGCTDSSDIKVCSPFTGPDSGEYVLIEHVFPKSMCAGENVLNIAVPSVDKECAQS